MAGEHDAPPGAEAELARGVRAVGEHGLELHGFEARVLHHRREEARQLALLAEHARDPADLPDELDGAPEVDRRQHGIGAISLVRLKTHGFAP